MLNLIRQNSLKIIGSQFVILLVLGYLLYGSYTQWEVETEIKRDTTIVTETETDTLWKDFGFDVLLSNPEPDSTIEEAEKDTTESGDTTYITDGVGVNFYHESFTRSLPSGSIITGTITSRVRGQLINQQLHLSARVPQINTVNTRFRTITKTVTKTQIGKWRVVASADAFFSLDNGIEVLAPGIGLQRPTEFSLFYKYDLMNGYHGVSVNVPLSLIF